MLSTCALFITLSWVISMIVFSSVKLKPFENSGKVLIKSDRINKYLGVPIFSYLIIHSPFRFFNPGVYVKSKSFKEIIRVHTEIRKAERNHIFAFLLVIAGSIVWLFFKSSITGFLFINLSNVIFNLYPVLALQLQRKRISKMVSKLLARGESGTSAINTGFRNNGELPDAQILSIFN